MTLNVGALNDRIRVEQRTEARDARTNEVTLTWALLAELWADIEDILPDHDEAKTDGIVLSSRPAKVKTRFYAILNSNMRFINLRDNRVLTIVSGPAEIGNKDGMLWMCNTFSTEGQGE